MSEVNYKEFFAINKIKEDLERQLKEAKHEYSLILKEEEIVINEVKDEVQKVTLLSNLHKRLDKIEARIQVVKDMLSEIKDALLNLMEASNPINIIKEDLMPVLQPHLDKIEDVYNKYNSILTGKQNEEISGS